MKKISMLLVSFMIFITTSVYTFPVSADSVTGRLLYTDISAYINHYPIPAYASDTGYIVVKVRDLEYYGFDVSWDEETRTANLDLKTSENNQTQISGIDNVMLPAQKTGIQYSRYTLNDTRLMFNGKSIDVYNACGSSFIRLEELNEVGEVYWVPELKAMKAWINAFSSTDYEPLAKASPEPKPIISDYSSYYIIDNTRNYWWFRKAPGYSEIDSSVVSLISNHKVIFRDTARPKKIYLTFDEGYEEGYTNQIIDVLNKYNIPAAFFITGDYLKESPELVERMLDYGYTVGNHTFKHPILPTVSPESAAYQISELSNRFAEMFGVNMNYIRPPEGSYSSRTLQLADDMGYKTVFWSFAYSDWDTANQKGADTAFTQIAPYLHDGAVMLLHACSSDNANVLDRLIQYILSEGYTFGSLDEIWV